MSFEIVFDGTAFEISGTLIVIPKTSLPVLRVNEQGEIRVTENGDQREV
jgi:hypothetical protein